MPWWIQTGFWPHKHKHLHHQPKHLEESEQCWLEHKRLFCNRSHKHYYKVILYFSHQQTIKFNYGFLLIMWKRCAISNQLTYGFVCVFVFGNSLTSLIKCHLDLCIKVRIKTKPASNVTSLTIYTNNKPQPIRFYSLMSAHLDIIQISNRNTDKAAHL